LAVRVHLPVHFGGEDKNINIIEQTVEKAVDHWLHIARQILALHQQDEKHCSVTIEALVKDNHI
jgi:hypothetical protein